MCLTHHQLFVEQSFLEEITSQNMTKTIEFGHRFSTEEGSPASFLLKQEGLGGAFTKITEENSLEYGLHTIKMS